MWMSEASGFAHPLFITAACSFLLFGEAPLPPTLLLWASCGGEPLQLAHKETFLEGLQPSKPPAWRATAFLISWYDDRTGDKHKT
jgi:hypothetical protein